MASSWSFSRLGDFDKCKKYYWLKHEQKVPEIERPLPEGKTEHANERGSRIHDAAENFVNGTGDFIKELSKFQPEFEHLRHLYAQGQVSLEGEWGMNRMWEKTGWNGEWVLMTDDRLTEVLTTEQIRALGAPKAVKALPERGSEGDVVKFNKQTWAWVPTWQRLKLDALVHVSDTEAIVIDYKTGRKFGNEVKHAQQLQLYQLDTFLRYPNLEIVHAELWYTDQDDITSATYRRDQGLRFLRTFDQRGKTLTSNKVWPANPNKFSCQYCTYGPDGTGDCPVGVRK